MHDIVGSVAALSGRLDEVLGTDGVAWVTELTDGLGAHSIIEVVGTQESTMQAIRSTRPGGHVVALLYALLGAETWHLLRSELGESADGYRQRPITTLQQSLGVPS